VTGEVRIGFTQLCEEMAIVEVEVFEVLFFGAGGTGFGALDAEVGGDDDVSGFAGER
jgi:hypothetical protein